MVARPNPPSNHPAQTARHGRTDAAGRFPLDLPFFLTFSDYLSSRMGGKKTPKQINEICTDQSKYLWFANPDTVDTEMLFSCVKIISNLESGGIGPSGVLSPANFNGYKRAATFPRGSRH